MYVPRGILIQKGQGKSLEILKKALRGAKVLFCGRGLKFVSPLTLLKQHIISYHIVFGLNILKSNVKASAVELKNAFLTPTGYDQHLVLFVW